MAVNLSEILRRHPRRIELRRLAFHFAGDAVIWLSIAGLVRFAAPAAALVPVALLFAAFSFRSFSFMHEAVHGSLAPRRALNDGLGELYGVFSFLPFMSWRRLHLDHHLWTGNVERDPSMRILLDFERGGRRVPGLVKWAWRSWVPVLGFMQHLVFWRATVTSREYFFLGGSLAYFGGALMLVGPLPLLAGFLAYLSLVEVVNFPHHLSLRQYQGDRRFTPAEQGAFVRSCLYHKWFAHFILLNFNLHTEHHLLPAHPWYQLDQIHAELAAQGGEYNFSNGNEWILSQRARPVEAVFAETFASEAEDAGEERKAA
jgi:omega-6 fatty acid desaturase (delta-12 desaturase)